MRYIYQNVAKDGNGHIIPEATINVFKAGGVVAANVYAASLGGSAVNSVTADDDGSFLFYVDEADYGSDQLFKTVTSKTGYRDFPLDDIRIYPFASAGYTEDLKPQKIFGGASNTNGHTVPNIADDIFALLAAVQGFLNKTLTTPIIAAIYQDAGKTKLMTLPNTASDILAAIAATQRFTNKTLAIPKIDSIVEETTDNGVSIDGFKIKDNAPDPTSWPSFSVHKNTTNQTGVATATLTLVTWDSTAEEWDTNANFASNKFTPQVAGKYLLSAMIEMTVTVDTKYLVVTIYKNGSVYKRGSLIEDGSTGGGADGITCIVDANGSTDYFEVYVEQNTGADKIIAGTVANTWFQGCRIG